jgi:adenosylhomocysteine nucleosidase
LQQFWVVRQKLLDRLLDQILRRYPAQDGDELELSVFGLGNARAQLDLGVGIAWTTRRPLKSMEGKFIMKNHILFSSLFLIVSSIGVSAEETSPLVDTTVRTAIISAYEPEWVELRAALHEATQYVIGRTTFLTGTIEGKPVLLFLSGISMVNAALTSQLAVDRFNVSRIVFSGIAGGVNSERSIGDVVVPSQWSEYLESAFARETKEGYVLPSFESKTVKNFGMIFPQPVQIARPNAEPEKLQWFPTDATLLALARKLEAVHLDSCTAEKTCLTRQPKLVIGGNGMSGQAFVDNRVFREYLRSAFTAEVVDMESAAIAQVAYINNRPFIAFRSLSDLAGADPDQNQEDVFEKLASQNSAMVVKAFIKELP